MASPHTTVATSNKAKYVGRLDTPRGVRVELARLYTEARRGNIDTADAYRLSLILGQLSKVMDVSELATRLEELEQAADPKLRIA